jgi:hypothetical protein
MDNFGELLDGVSLNRVTHVGQTLGMRRDQALGKNLWLIFSEPALRPVSECAHALNALL